LFLKSDATNTLFKKKTNFKQKDNFN